MYDVFETIILRGKIAQQIGDYFNILLKERLTCFNQYIKFKRHIIYEFEINKKNQDTQNLITEEFINNYKYILTEEYYSITFKFENGKKNTSIL